MQIDLSMGRKTAMYPGSVTACPLDNVSDSLLSVLDKALSACYGFHHVFAGLSNLSALLKLVVSLLQLASKMESRGAMLLEQWLW
jgi:hypothetical protein